MDPLGTRRQHAEITLAGFRSHAAAVGLIQLIRELRRARVLDDDAVGRVRDAVVDEFTLSKSVHVAERDFRDRLTARLDRLLAPGA